MMGISYPGFYTSCGMIDSHPALKCASPQAPVGDWFIGDDFHHNGAFYLPHAFRWLSSFGQKLEDPTREPAKPFDYKTPDGYEFYLKMGPLANADKLHFKGKIAFWNELMEHGTYDEFWKARNLRPHLKNVKCGRDDRRRLVRRRGPVRHAGHLSRGRAATIPASPNMLVMGPWAHGGWSGGDGDHARQRQLRRQDGEFYREQIELPFLKHYLEGRAAKLEACRRRMSSRPARTSGGDTTPGRRRTRQRASRSISTPAAGSRSSRRRRATTRSTNT